MASTEEETKKSGAGDGGDPATPREDEKQQQQQQQMPDEEEPPQGSLVGLCVGCFCCLLCTPILVLCCCCCGANAAVQKARGRRWDSKQGRWVVDNLATEASTLQDVPDDDSDIIRGSSSQEEAEKPAEEGTTSGAKIEVKETAYYEALGVSPDADESKIKRAYYVNARKWHPDRNDSAEAKAKFQQIGEAYQVLSDPKLRAVYDKEGQAGLSGDRTEVAMEKLDPSLVFTFLFGSDEFNDYVGRLELVTQIMIDDENITHDQILELERRRVLRLALKLRDRIQKHVDGDTETALTEWKTVAEHLVEVRYGEEILNVVGSSYRLVATQCYADSWGEGMEAKVSEHEMQTDAARAAYANAQNMQQNKADMGGEAQDQLPAYIEMLWKLTVIDITSTLREVVLKVVLDKSVDSSVRKKRANAIKALGEIFESQKSSKTNDGSDGNRKKSVRGMYQSAAQAAMEETLKKMKEQEGKTET